MASTYLVEIADQTESDLIDQALLKNATEAALKRFKIPKAVFSIGIVDGKQMKDLNNQYLSHDYDTDVLSFCLHDPEDESFSGDAGETADSGEAIEAVSTDEMEIDEEEFLPEGQEFGFDSLQGQLIVSLDYAQKQANQLGVSLNDELALYVVHGSLHVLGFDDQSDEDRQEMRMLEKEILATIGIEPVWPADSSSEDSGASLIDE